MRYYLRVTRLVRLDNRGVAHYLLPLFAVVLVAIGGTYLLVASHADQITSSATSASTPATQTVNITNSNSGQTVTLSPSQALVVTLTNTYAVPQNMPAGQSANSSSWWNGFSSSNPTVMTSALTGDFSDYSGRYIKGNYLISGKSIHRYLAGQQGTAVISATSTSNLACGAGIACPSFVTANTFKITVNVN